MTNEALQTVRALIERAQLQTQANRYGFLRRQADAKLVQTVAKS